MRKIDIEKSTIYEFNYIDDLRKCAKMLGEKGYFSDCAYFSEYDTGVLLKVRHIGSNYSFVRFLSEEDSIGLGYRYFIPAIEVVFLEEKLNMETNTKIDTELSTIYRFDNKKDLADCVGMLGKNGYFSKDEDFHTYDYGTLSEVRCSAETKRPFVRIVGGNNCYGYFIPELLVTFKEEEEDPKCRPFAYMDELPFKVGDVITIRVKDTLTVADTIVTEITYKDHKIEKFCIGLRSWITPKCLFEGYELLKKGEWVPFGIIKDGYIHAPK